MSIQKVRTKDGFVYKVRVRVVDQTTGTVRHPSRSFRFKRDAERAERDWQAEVDRGTAVDPRTITLGAYLRQWLVGQDGRLKATSVAHARDAMETYVIPKLGTIPLQKLTAVQVQEFEDGLLRSGSIRTGKGLSKTYVHAIHVGLKSALTAAVKLGMLPRNVCDAVTPPPIEHPPKVLWDQAQAQTFLRIAEGDGYWPLWLLALATGMRRGELIGVRWRDVDLKAGTLTVRTNVTVPNGRLEEGTPKGGRSRTMHLDRRVMAVLDLERRKQIARHVRLGAGWSEHTPVVTTAAATIVHPINLSDRFRTLVKTIPDLPRIRLHDTRHTFASLMLSAGVPLHVVSAMLGHANPAITMRIYAHLLTGQDEQASRIMASVLLDPVQTDTGTEEAR